MSATDSNLLDARSRVHLALRDSPAPIEPYEHQQRTWERMTRHFLDDGKPAGMVVLPTGGGKTVVAAHWLLRNVVAQGGRVLWLANRQQLLTQAFQTFQRLGNLAHPQCAKLNLVAVSSVHQRWSMVGREDDVVFASVQSSVLESNRGFVKQMLADAGPNAFVVVDEAHHAVAPRTLALLKELKAAGVRLLGLTATPIRMDDTDQRRLGVLFDGAIIHQVARRTLSELGILAEPATKTVETRIDVERDMDEQELRYLERYGDLGPSVLARLGKNAGRNSLIVDQYVEHRGEYGPTIVFAADTLHAQTLAIEFQRRGVQCDYVDYSRNNAAEVIERYARGELEVIVNVQMLTEGFDAPRTRTVFIARPTRSVSLLIQMVGRAMRGPKAGGNETANLVTFLDTWKQFDVLGAEYALDAGVPPPDPETAVQAPQVLERIPPELIRDAYRLLLSSVKGHLVGVYACIPDGRYHWTEEFEDDVQDRSVTVFDTQREALEELLAGYPSAETMPDVFSEDEVLRLIRRHFADVPDPLPRWADVKALLDAKRKSCTLNYVSFEEKRDFDPRALAKRIVDEKMPPEAEAAFLESVWAEQPACALVYRNDQRTFREEVGRERSSLLNAAIPKEPTHPAIVALVPKGPPAAWPAGHPGRSLSELFQAVVAIRRHFPNGAPTIGDLRWMTHGRQRLWGFFRFQDKHIALSPLLNSPDVPRFVTEFVLFHELLHGEFTEGGHSREFRERERKFLASPIAIEEATSLGLAPSPQSPADHWRVRADQFLDTFERSFRWEQPKSEWPQPTKGHAERSAGVRMPGDEQTEGHA